MASLPSSRPRRRSNHNEIEKKRREHQRHCMDVLRDHIPGLKNSRPSAVAIITAAVNHISSLVARTQELEAYIRNAGLVCPPSTVGQQHQQQQFISVPVEPHTLPGDALFSYICAYNNGPASTPPPGASLASPSPKKSPHIVRTATEEAFEAFANHSLPMILPKKGSISRRDSAMLLPTNDPNTFLFGKRDSMQNFFAGSLPGMFEDAPTAIVSCSKCHRGVDNLIMIDCDQCHSWYHIRCVAIDPTCIPLQWSCPECHGRPHLA